ncbi:MAG: AAA family ATPase [Clostridia bacterium]|nr:AAA family ATPase [Clostridia bacterium]
MKRIIALGSQDFESIRVNGDFYIDKSRFICEWWKNRDPVTVITRPRRFGKTLNMSMLNCFFSNRYAGRSELFDGLDVSGDSVLDQQGKWPVLFLSFANVKQCDWEDARCSINQTIADMCQHYRQILQDPMFSEEDRAFFKKVNAEMPDDVAAISVNRLCGWLARYYGRKVLILLDEYDTPLQEAYMYGFWDRMTMYIRSLFSNTFIANPYLERALMTGIIRVSKESIFSDLNSLEVVTTSSAKYADAFGFTEEEVFTALEQQGYGDRDKQEVKQWYDGYTFGDLSDIYNPWSVTNYLDKGIIDTYWSNTSENGLAGKLVRTGGLEIKRLFENLMKGEAIIVPVDEQVIYSQLETDPNAVWSLLLATGYLKTEHMMTEKEAAENKSRRMYTLRLTNLEVSRMFTKLIRDWFAKSGGLGSFTTAMLTGDVRGMNITLGDIMLTSMSSFDGGKNPSVKLPENFYHGLVLGLLAENTRDYLVTSNRESGWGRYDVVMEPNDIGKPAVIMEFKV